VSNASALTKLQAMSSERLRLLGLISSLPSTSRRAAQNICCRRHLGTNGHSWAKEILLYCPSPRRVGIKWGDEWLNPPSARERADTMLDHVAREVVGMSDTSNLLTVDEALCVILERLRHKRLECRNLVLGEGQIDGHGKYLDHLMPRFVDDPLHVERTKSASQRKHENPVLIAAG